MSVEEDLAAIKRRLSQAQSAQAKAEYQHEQASTKLAEAKLALLNEFGVQTNDDIKRLLTHLQDEYAAELAAIEQELEGAGG